MRTNLLRQPRTVSQTGAADAPSRAARAGGKSRVRRARAALAGLALLAGMLYGWGLWHASYQPFYADAVRSMTENWKAFVFGSFDPGNTVTLDKLPGFLWPQALSARLFGFHPWSVTLPQVLEGVLSVLVLERVVRRWAGVRAGLTAAALFALTPVVTGLFRGATEEPAFTLLLLLAAEATQRAARRARPGPLLLAGLWVGLAFQCKMLEAYAVLPALAVVYAVTAPTGLRRRLAHLGLAGAVALAVSASWIALVSAVPAADRPHVDGTTDDSTVTMVIDYNFLNRFSSLGISAADSGAVPASRHNTPQGGFLSTTGTGKMLSSALTAQTGWLYPFAAAAAIVGFRRRRGRPGTDPLRAGFLLWCTWLAAFLVIFSAGSIGGHVYYMGVIAAPVAALSGAGTALFWQDLRRGNPWPLAAAVATTVVWECVTALRFSGFLPWLTPLLAVLGLLTVLALRACGKRAVARSPLRTVQVLVLVSVLVGPAAWSFSVLDPSYAHSSGIGGVGPVAELGTGEVTLTSSQEALLAYTSRHAPGARHPFAVTSWAAASPYILAAGAPVLPMGGFTGEAPVPTPAQFRAEVSARRLRYVVLPASGAPASAPAAEITPWVRASCTPVTALRFADPTQTLYDCARAQR